MVELFSDRADDLQDHIADTGYVPVIVLKRTNWLLELKRVKLDVIRIVTGVTSAACMVTDALENCEASVADDTTTEKT